MATYDLTSSIPSSSSLETGDILNCPYSGSAKSITLPKGTYKLECWGAQGGNAGYYSYVHSTPNGGKGGYSAGVITLSSSVIVYLYAGGQGGSTIGNKLDQNSVATAPGGFNGGGIANQMGAAGGGGASDIRIGQDSLYARIIVAGGGGGGGNASSSTLLSYGGNGGGTTGGTPPNQHQNRTPGKGGTQTGIVASYSSSISAGFGNGAGGTGNNLRGAGGGGWYGGTMGENSTGGGGGSGYVYTSSTASNYPSGCLLNSTHYLSSASTIAGDTSFTSPTGSSETGHSGNGYIRITVQSLVNWAYSTVSIPAPTYNKQDTSSWTLSPSTCRYFSFTPTISGDFIVYSNSSIDTYGHLTSSITSLNSNGQPSSNILVSDDDSAKKYGGSGGNFGICYKVTAGTTYYIFVKPYNNNTASNSVYLTYYMAHPDSRVYVKTDSTTWKLITN